MSRPGWFLGLAWFVSCLIGVWLSLNVLLAVTIGSLLGTVLMLVIPTWRKQGTWLLVALAASGSFLMQTWLQAHVYLPSEQKIGATITLETQVYEQNTHTYVQVLGGDLPVGTRLQLRVTDPNVQPQLYDTVCGTFTLRGYDQRGLALLHQKASGVRLIVVPQQTTIARATPPWTAVFDRWRTAALATIRAHLQGDAAALTAGICFGLDDDLSLEAENAFRACGVSHLFSVSGFHMALLSQALAAVLRRSRLPRLLRGALIVTVLLLFMAVVGLHPSVVRSGVLCLLTVIGGCFRRQADTRNSLGLALLLLLVGDPFAAYDVGLLLSFVATFGLVLVFPKINAAAVSLLPTSFFGNHPKLFGWAKRLISAVALTVAATVTTAPISAICFGELSLAAVLGNLLTSFPASAVLVVGCLGSLCIPSVLQPLQQVFFFLTGWLCRYLVAITGKISNFLPATVAITDTYLLLWIVGTIGLVWLGYRTARRNGVRLTVVVSACTLLLSVTVHSWLMKDVTTVCVLAADGETAVCVQHRDHAVLICAPRSIDTVYDIRTALRKSGVKRLDLMAIPCVDEAVAASSAMLLSEPLADAAVLYGTQAQSITAHAENATIGDGREFQLWDDTVLGMYGSFVTLAVGQTRYVFCLRETSVRELPTTWWLADVVTVGDHPPADLALMVSETVIASAPCDRPPSAYGTKQLVTADDDVVMMTRGMGDTEWK